MTKIIDD